MGWGSVLLWSADADLFTFRQADPVAHVIVRSLAVASINNTKSADSTAFRFSAGFVRGTFDSLLFAGQSAAVSTSLRIPYGATYQSLGSCIDMGAVSDTSSVVNTVMWFLIGTGVKIGAGSEIRILGEFRERVE